MPMTPLLSEGWARRLQGKARASMRHRVTLLTPVVSRDLVTGEETSAYTEGTVQPGLLMMGGTRASELAAAHGVKGDGTLRLKLGQIALPGQLAQVSGFTRGYGAWSRLVEITAGTDLTNRLFGLALVADIGLNQ